MKRKYVLLAAVIAAAMMLVSCSGNTPDGSADVENKGPDTAQTGDDPTEDQQPDSRDNIEVTLKAADHTELDFGYANSEGERVICDLAIDEDGSYTSAQDVAAYLVTYGHLPGNFITKKEARALGWEGGSLEPYAPGCCIGGDRFGNYEGTLPEGDYHECDIDTLGADRRGAKRLVYSDDGRIYYTEDHYESFTLLYGEED